MHVKNSLAQVKDQFNSMFYVKLVENISREYKYKCELIMLGKAMDLPQFHVFHFQLEKCALF